MDPISSAPYPDSSSILVSITSSREKSSFVRFGEGWSLFTEDPEFIKNISWLLQVQAQVRVVSQRIAVVAPLLAIRVFPFPQSENMNLDDKGGKAWSCGGDATSWCGGFHG
ncbi:hypothetical protein F2Q70_00002040 [Brassica cretica]|uniref:Uncharacterized protein n=1 Tax=Brassica cretica TaxID=69181 RepID=A0A8S9IN80_BRACR|nr:hypothetical protein F2Q70_00002040 [Brassica cretica]